MAHFCRLLYLRPRTATIWKADSASRTMLYIYHGGGYSVFSHTHLADLMICAASPCVALSIAHTAAIPPLYHGDRCYRRHLLSVTAAHSVPAFAMYLPFCIRADIMPLATPADHTASASIAISPLPLLLVTAIPSTVAHGPARYSYAVVGNALASLR